MIELDESDEEVDENLLVCWSIFLLLVGIFVGILIGFHYEEKQIREFAVARGYAHWTVDRVTGKTSFEWLK